MSHKLLQLFFLFAMAVFHIIHVVICPSFSFISLFYNTCDALGNGNINASQIMHAPQHMN